MNLPDAYTEQFYDWVDDTIQKAGLSLPGKMPRGAKTVGKQLEADLYRTLRSKIDGFLKSVGSNAPKHEVYYEIMEIVVDWQRVVAKQLGESFEKIYLWGLAAGIADSQVQPVVGMADKMAMEFIKANPNRIGSAINQFSNEIVSKFRSVIEVSYTPEGEFELSQLVRSCGKIVADERYKLERIVRTETASVSNYGRILGWEKDEYRYFYDYNWNAAIDNRSKPISILRMRGGPYTFDEIKFLWENQEQLINGKWFNDVFNQRCSISRTPREDIFTGNRFEGNINYKQTL